MKPENPTPPVSPPPAAPIEDDSQILVKEALAFYLWMMEHRTAGDSAAFSLPDDPQELEVLKLDAVKVWQKDIAVRARSRSFAQSSLLTLSALGIPPKGQKKILVELMEFLRTIPACHAYEADEHLKPPMK